MSGAARLLLLSEGKQRQRRLEFPKKPGVKHGQAREDVMVETAGWEVREQYILLSGSLTVLVEGSAA